MRIGGRVTDVVYRSSYACGTCGDRTLVISCPSAGVWQVTCGNDHTWTPMPGTMITIDLAGPFIPYDPTGDLP